MALFELINLRKIRKALLYIFCIIIALWLQSMIFSRVMPLEVKSLFLPVLVVAIGLFEGGVWGGVLGLFAGLCCDSSISDSKVLFLILFSAFGFLSGLLADFFITRRFLSYLVLSAFALFITAFCQAIPLWIFHGTDPNSLFSVALLQTLWSLPFCVPAFFLTKTIAGHQQALL